MRSLLWKVIPCVDVSVITVLGPRLLCEISEGSEVEGWSRKAEEQPACDAERWITLSLSCVWFDLSDPHSAC